VAPSDDYENSGDCILVQGSTGDENYSNTVVNLRTTFSCYSINEIRALLLAERVVKEAIHGKQGMKVIYSTIASVPTVMPDPLVQDWFIGLVYYNMHVRLL